MTDAAATAGPGVKPARTSLEAQEARLKRRYAAERRFRAYGLLAISVALAFLALLVGRMVLQGYTTFWNNQVALQVYVDPGQVDRADLSGANYANLIAQSVMKRVGAVDDDLGENLFRAQALTSEEAAYGLRDRVVADPSLIGKTVEVKAPVSANSDLYFKGEMKRDTPQEFRKLDDLQLTWLDKLRQQGSITTGFNTAFFTNADSTQPELAGVLGGVIGSALMLIVTAALAIPVGVLAAVYLEEFAPKNRLTEIIEVNINNLAAVPSIVYGLLGLALFINTFGMPRSSPLVGGLVLGLMALPTVIIATRSSLKAVPPSIREAALGVGASRTQAVFHHVLPLAMPGVMTGAILSLAHALGETAPLLMIGMVSFAPGLPEGFLSAASPLPVQVFIWENASERGFHERTAAAILVLLTFMVVMNAAAIWLRSRFERRW